MPMEISFPEISQAFSADINRAVDLHLNNLLLQLPSSLDDISVEKLYETYGKPLIYPVRLSIPGHDINLAEAKLMLSDFGTAFRPAD
ncbi:hypothetical protein E4U23_006490, partial [Claviceps purpurea]